jgi:hypothetical protein
LPASTSYIPSGSPNLAPYLIVKDASAALDFYRTVFAAVEQERISGPDGRVRHAGIRIGAALVMIGEHSAAAVPESRPFPDLCFRAASRAGGSGFVAGAHLPTQRASSLILSSSTANCSPPARRDWRSPLSPTTVTGPAEARIIW